MMTNRNETLAYIYKNVQSKKTVQQKKQTTTITKKELHNLISLRERVFKQNDLTTENGENHESFIEQQKKQNDILIERGTVSRRAASDVITKQQAGS